MNAKPERLVKELVSTRQVKETAVGVGTFSAEFHHTYGRNAKKCKMIEPKASMFHPLGKSQASSMAL